MSLLLSCHLGIRADNSSNKAYNSSIETGHSSFNAVASLLGPRISSKVVGGALFFPTSSSLLGSCWLSLGFDFFEAPDVLRDIVKSMSAPGAKSNIRTITDDRRGAAPEVVSTVSLDALEVRERMGNRTEGV